MIADTIRSSEEDILREWCAFASEFEAAHCLSEVQLRDHAREMLRAIACDTETHQTDAAQFNKSRGKGESGALELCGTQHSATRFEQGFKLEFLIAEFRALRACVTRRWLEADNRNGDVITGLVRFNEAIDQVLIRSAAEHAQRISLERDNLEAVLAHDLRTPLTAIRLCADVLTTNKVPDRINAFASRCRRSAVRMERLIDGLLDINRLRRGDCLQVLPRPMDMVSMVQEATAEARAAYPHATIHTECPERVAGVWDRDRLGQVIGNLLTNAIKYGDEGRTITVHVVEAKHDVWLEVHNHGQPIAPADIARIFDPFTRAASNARHDSVGLGLHIVKKIVLAHRGDIVAQSSARTGTSFRVVLPRQSHAEIDSN